MFYRKAVLAGCLAAGFWPIGCTQETAATEDAALAGSSGSGGSLLVVPDADVPTCDGGPCPAVCEGVVCRSGQICCLLEGGCIDPADAPLLCPKPAVGACASNADCAPTEFCDSPVKGACLGAGSCVPRAGCSSAVSRVVCGCDDTSYRDRQAACTAGVRTFVDVSCF